MWKFSFDGYDTFSLKIENINFNTKLSKALDYFDTIEFLHSILIENDHTIIIKNGNSRKKFEYKNKILHTNGMQITLDQICPTSIHDTIDALTDIYYEMGMDKEIENFISY